MLLLAVCACGATEVDREPDPIVLFDCGDGKTRYRLLGRDGDYLSVEMSKSDAPNITLETYMWSDIRIGRVQGQEGGYQAHIRFSDRLDHFVLFEGEDGNLAESPGRTYAGVARLEAKDPAEAARVVTCAATEVNRNVVTAVQDWQRARQRTQPAEEEPGGQFDAWF